MPKKKILEDDDYYGYTDTNADIISNAQDDLTFRRKVRLPPKMKRKIKSRKK